MANGKLSGVALLQGDAQPNTKIIAVNQRTGDYYETTSASDGTYEITVSDLSDQYLVSAVYDGTDGLFPADPQAYVEPKLAIPDSVVSRDADNNSVSTTKPHGIMINSAVTWPKIQGRISQNVSGANRVILTEVGGSQIATEDVSGLTSGDVFTISNISLSANTDYTIELDANGASFTIGFDSDATYPYTSADGDLSIVDGAKNAASNNAASCINEVGNINL